MSPLTKLLATVTGFFAWVTLALYVSGGVIIDGRHRLGYIQDFLRILAALLALAWIMQVPFGRLSIVRGFSELPGWLKRVRPRTHAGWALSFAFVWLLACFFAAPLARHWGYQSWFYDLALMEQMIWRGAQGLGFTSTVLGGVNSAPLAFTPNNHLNLSLYPIAWVYRLFPHTETLLLLQSFLLLLPIVPLYRIGERLLRPAGVPAFVLPLIYWCWDSVHRVNLWDFHDTPFMVAAGAWSYLFFLRGNLYAAAFSAAAMALVKEDAWFTAGVMGFYFCWMRKRPGWGLFCALIGAAVFLGHAAFWNQVNSVAERYAYLEGKSVGQAVLHLAQNPWILVTQLLKPESLQFLWGMITVGGGAWLLAGGAVLPVLPTLLMCALSTHAGMLSMESHYMMSVAAPLLFAIAVGLKNLANWARAHAMRAAVPVVVVLAVLNLALGEAATIRRAWAQSQTPERRAERECFQRLLAQIPKEAPVFAHDPLGAQLARRPLLYQYHAGQAIGLAGAYAVGPSSDPVPPGTRLLDACSGLSVWVR